MEQPGNEDRTEVIVTIVLVIIIVAFILLIIVGYYLSNRTTNNTPAIIINNGGFLSSCTTTICSNDFVCDGTTFTCKLPINNVCTNSSDCVTGLICSGSCTNGPAGETCIGLCSSGPTGGLNQLCPCNSNYICTIQSNSLGVCKGKRGVQCSNNSDCASGLCDNNLCTSGFMNATPCNANVDCESNNCSNGFCQSSGFISGTIGSACSGNCVSFIGARCIGTTTQPLSCSCLQGQGNPGTCVAATQGIISGCSTNILCADELVCYNNNANICIEGETGCSCLFPYNNPNVLNPGSICIEGMTNRNNQCYNNSGLGCDNGNMCINNACSGGPVLAAYRFSKDNTSNLKTKFIGATTTSLVGLSGPTGNIRPYKMFAVSNANFDTIYLVDTIQGLLTVTIDSNTLRIEQSWQIAIPRITTTATTRRILVDVAFNGINYIIIFNETENSTGKSNTTLYTTGVLNVAPVVYNVQPGSGLPGTQYTTSGIPLNIDYIDISAQNDLLITSGGTAYLKLLEQATYSIVNIQRGPLNQRPITNVIGPAEFYFDTVQNPGGTGPAICAGTGTNSPIICPDYYNIAFVAPFTNSIGQSYPQILQFSGNVAGIALPIDQFNNISYRVFDYSIYSPPSGMKDASIIMLTTAYNNNIVIDNMVAISFGGNSTILPYRISESSKAVTTDNAFYILSIGSCR